MPGKLEDFVNISRFKAVLCLDGKLPSKTFFDALKIPIIAADGATNKLCSIGITPNFVIGDCDSVNINLLNSIPHLKDEDQNSSDFQKAMNYMRTNALCPAIICGVSGGHLDHIINNVGIFMENPENVFIDDEIIGFCLHADHEFEFPIDTKLSIFGMPKCAVTSEGLKWELINSELSFPGKNSCFNRVIASKLSFKIQSGSALLIVYRNRIKDAGIS